MSVQAAVRIQTRHTEVVIEARCLRQSADGNFSRWSNCDRLGEIAKGTRGAKIEQGRLKTAVNATARLYQVHAGYRRNPHRLWD